MVKNGWNLLDHQTLKSGVLPRWFDKLSRLIERYLNADIDGVVFGVIANIFCIFDI